MKVDNKVLQQTFFVSHIGKLVEDLMAPAVNYEMNKLRFHSCVNDLYIRVNAFGGLLGSFEVS